MANFWSFSLSYDLLGSKISDHPKNNAGKTRTEERGQKREGYKPRGRQVFALLAIKWGFSYSSEPQYPCGYVCLWDSLLVTHSLGSTQPLTFAISTSNCARHWSRCLIMVPVLFVMPALRLALL